MAENEKEGTFQSPPIILPANILPKAVIHKIFSQILHQKPIFNTKIHTKTYKQAEKHF